MVDLSSRNNSQLLISNYSLSAVDSFRDWLLAPDGKVQYLGPWVYEIEIICSEAIDCVTKPSTLGQGAATDTLLDFHLDSRGERRGVIDQ